MSDLIFIIFIAVISIFLILKKLYKIKRNKILMAKLFCDEYKIYLTNNLSLYKHLPDDLKEQLHGLINIFLYEKKFEGCGGLTVTEEMKITVAAEACILLLNRKNKDYPKLYSIVLYPHPYVASNFTPVGGQYVKGESIRAGESWVRGDVILAWDNVKKTAYDGSNGHNVVLHEFAHQLDQEDGQSDGCPILEKKNRYLQWSKVLGSEYEKLLESIKFHKKNVIDDYGATNPAEFFAVATETFFEKPNQLKKQSAQLYDQLKEYYHLDPISWIK